MACLKSDAVVELNISKGLVQLETSRKQLQILIIKYSCDNGLTEINTVISLIII